MVCFIMFEKQDQKSTFGKMVTLLDLGKHWTKRLRSIGVGIKTKQAEPLSIQDNQLWELGLQVLGDQCYFYVECTKISHVLILLLFSFITFY